MTSGKSPTPSSSTASDKAKENEESKSPVFRSTRSTRQSRASDDPTLSSSTASDKAREDEESKSPVFKSTRTRKFLAKGATTSGRVDKQPGKSSTPSKAAASVGIGATTPPPSPTSRNTRAAKTSGTATSKSEQQLQESNVAVSTEESRSNEEINLPATQSPKAAPIRCSRATSGYPAAAAKDNEGKSLKKFAKQSNPSEGIIEPSTLPPSPLARSLRNRRAGMEIDRDARDTEATEDSNNSGKSNETSMAGPSGRDEAMDEDEAVAKDGKKRKSSESALDSTEASAPKKSRDDDGLPCIVAEECGCGEVSSNEFNRAFHHGLHNHDGIGGDCLFCRRHTSTIPAIWKHARECNLNPNKGKKRAKGNPFDVCKPAINKNDDPEQYVLDKRYKINSVKSLCKRPIELLMVRVWPCFKERTIMKTALELNDNEGLSYSCGIATGALCQYNKDLADYNHASLPQNLITMGMIRDAVDESLALLAMRQGYKFIWDKDDQLIIKYRAKTYCEIVMPQLRELLETGIFVDNQRKWGGRNMALVATAEASAQPPRLTAARTLLTAAFTHRLLAANGAVSVTLKWLVMSNSRERDDEHEIARQRMAELVGRGVEEHEFARHSREALQNFARGLVERRLATASEVDSSVFAAGRCLIDAQGEPQAILRMMKLIRDLSSRENINEFVFYHTDGEEYIRQEHIEECADACQLSSSPVRITVEPVGKLLIARPASQEQSHEVIDDQCLQDCKDSATDLVNLENVRLDQEEHTRYIDQLMKRTLTHTILTGDDYYKARTIQLGEIFNGNSANSIHDFDDVKSRADNMYSRNDTELLAEKNVADYARTSIPKIDKKKYAEVLNVLKTLGEASEHVKVAADRRDAITLNQYAVKLKGKLEEAIELLENVERRNDAFYDPMAFVGALQKPHEPLRLLSSYSTKVHLERSNEDMLELLGPLAVVWLGQEVLDLLLKFLSCGV